MKVKIVKPIVGVTLYFCPNCMNGHMVDYKQNKCEICGTNIEWPNSETNVEQCEGKMNNGKQNKRMFNNNHKKIRHKVKQTSNRARN